MSKFENSVRMKPNILGDMSGIKSTRDKKITNLKIYDSRNNLIKLKTVNLNNITPSNRNIQPFTNNKQLIPFTNNKNSEYFGTPRSTYKKEDRLEKIDKLDKLYKSDKFDKFEDKFHKMDIFDDFEKLAKFKIFTPNKSKNDQRMVSPDIQDSDDDKNDKIEKINRINKIQSRINNRMTKIKPTIEKEHNKVNNNYINPSIIDSKKKKLVNVNTENSEKENEIKLNKIVNTTYSNKFRSNSHNHNKNKSDVIYNSTKIITNRKSTFISPNYNIHLFKNLLKLYSRKKGSLVLFKILNFLGNDDLKIIYMSSKRVKLLIDNIIKENCRSLVKKIRTGMSKYFTLLKVELVSSQVKDNIIIQMRLSSRIDAFVELSSKSKSSTLIWGIFTKSLLNKNSPFLSNIYTMDIQSNSSSNNIHKWICREFTEFHLDKLDSSYIQPVQNFRPDDIAVFSFNVFTGAGTGFIDFNNANFSIKLMNNNNNNTFGLGPDTPNPRICEMEMLKSSWKDLKYHTTNLLNLNMNIQDKMNQLFGAHFYIDKILFDDVGFIIFKVCMTAIKKGVINNSKELGMIIKVVENNGVIKNEVKKNNLIYESSRILELRVNDVLIFYLSHSNNNTQLKSL